MKFQSKFGLLIFSVLVICWMQTTILQAAEGTVHLPLELIGPDGYIESVSYTLSQPGEIDRLWLRVHRPGYRDQLINPNRSAKASVKINDGPWMDLLNHTVTVDTQDMTYGGIGGGHLTVAMTLPVSALLDGENTVSFRFNGTDGFTSGYRVLDMVFLKSDGSEVPPQNGKSYEDPANWEPPLPAAVDIADGKELWLHAQLVESPLAQDVTLRGTCASCHATDGRDLKYFNFSNWSIQERAKFHGLTQTEAEQIASYIRSLDTPAPPQATPWNPPYQPGPGLDALPVEAWAAGAGLEAVLRDDAEMRPYLFPEYSRGEVDENAILNIREIPVSMQFPDWNAWLPEIAPEDVWGDFFFDSVFDDSDGDTRGDLMGHYLTLLEGLENDGVEDLLQRGKLEVYLERFTVSGIKYYLDGRFHNAEAQIPPTLLKEEGVRSVRHWTVVKLWGLSQQYGLEDLAPQVYGTRGEVRSWLGGQRGIFDLAPHLSADVDPAFVFQTDLLGKYTSTAWYQLQMTLNAGNREGGQIAPVDWNYQPAHVSDLYQKVGGPAHPYRAAQTWAKLIQSFSGEGNLENGTVRDQGAFVRQANPGRWIDFDVFETLDIPERSALFTALLNSYMDAVETVALEEWERDLTAPARWEPADYVPLETTRFVHDHHKGYYADVFWSSIRLYNTWRVDKATLYRMTAWGAQMWPLGDWTVLNNEIAVRSDSYQEVAGEISWGGIAAALQAPDADADGDGLSNELELMLGTNLLQKDIMPFPVMDLTSSTGGSALRLRWMRSAMGPNLTAVFSENLSSWTPDLSPDYDPVTGFYTSTYLPTSGQAFGRLTDEP